MMQVYMHQVVVAIVHYVSHHDYKQHPHLGGNLSLFFLIIIGAQGDSSREPYQCTHTVLLAHASVVHDYRDRYQKSQGGRIGITLNSDWSVPLTDSQADRDAAQRNLDFMLGISVSQQSIHLVKSVYIYLFVCLKVGLRIRSF
jgi:hypothetical protein